MALRRNAAWDLFTRVTELSPRDAEAWLYLGLAERQLGNEPSARVAFRRAHECDPANAYARSMSEL